MNIRFATLALPVACAIAAAALAPALADPDDNVGVGPHGAPSYQRWQAGWDRDEFDRHHVILGTVTHFQPFRLQIARRDGNVQMIDLKNGTIILPNGATPSINERVAIVGYYSRGRFVANRIFIRA